MHIHIIKIRQEHLPCVDILLGELHQLHVLARPDQYQPSPHPYTSEELNALTDEAHSVSFLALADGQPAGICLSRIKEVSHPLLVPKKVGYIEALFVLPNFRRQHIAQKLLQHTRDAFQGLDIHEIQLCVWQFNQEASAFYEKEGFHIQRSILELKE